jgi:hypothetical protein
MAVFFNATIKSRMIMQELSTSEMEAVAGGYMARAGIGAIAGGWSGWGASPNAGGSKGCGVGVGAVLGGLAGAAGFGPGIAGGVGGVGAAAVCGP